MKFKKITKHEDLPQKSGDYLVYFHPYISSRKKTMITNYDIGKCLYGDIGVDKMVLILTEHHPCCEFCAKRFDQKNCKMECEEGVEEWLLQEAEKDG